MLLLLIPSFILFFFETMCYMVFTFSVYSEILYGTTLVNMSWSACIRWSLENISWYCCSGQLPSYWCILSVWPIVDIVVLKSLTTVAYFLCFSFYSIKLWLISFSDHYWVHIYLGLFYHLAKMDAFIFV